MYWDIKKDNEGGFDFSNYERNKSLNTNLNIIYTRSIYLDYTRRSFTLHCILTFDFFCCFATIRYFMLY